MILDESSRGVKQIVQFGTCMKNHIEHQKQILYKLIYIPFNKLHVNVIYNLWAQKWAMCKLYVVDKKNSEKENP